MKLNYLVILFLFTITSSFGQNKETCKVVNDDLQGSYTGQCTNGLADGKGEFTFANGSFVYVGSFKEGKIDGKGEIFSIVKNKRTSIKKGNWEDNVYVGNKSEPYQVGRAVNLDRYTVTKNVGSEKKVMINFYQNGNRNNVQNLSVAVNNGERIIGTYADGYENVSFPFICRVNYTTKSKLGQTSYTVSFDIQINEPGSWEIFLYN